MGERVQAATRGGELEADVCVIAVPASVLDRIAFEPALPRALRDALERVQYGHAAKLFVPLTSPARPSAVMSVPERYWTWTATGDGGDAQPVVSAFAGSAPALVALQTAAGPTRWLDSLERLRPDPTWTPGARCCPPGTTTRGCAPPTRPRRRRSWRRPWNARPGRSRSQASTPRESTRV
jgi:hypothetical protein